MVKNHKGFFVVLDGGEGSGKTLLLKKVAELHNENIVFTREPGGSMYAEEIRNLILNSSNAKQADANTFFSLFWAARADHLKNIIIPALNDGKIVICDRFDSSTYAYQIVAQGARELKELFWLTREHFLEKGEYEPDIYVYLDVDPETGLARKNKQVDAEKNHFDERELDFHKKLRQGFKEFFENPLVHSRTGIINAEKSEEDVWQEFKKLFFSSTAR